MAQQYKKTALITGMLSYKLSYCLEMILGSGYLINKNSIEVVIALFDCMLHFEYPHILDES